MLKKRNEIDESLKWDLTRLFKTEADYKNSLKNIEDISKKLEEKYKGKIKDENDVLSLLDEYSAFLVEFDSVRCYSYLPLSTDMTDEENQKRDALFDLKSAEINTRIKFIENELMELSEEVIQKAIQKTASYKTYLSKISENKKHQLSAESEELLATLSPILDLSYRGYEVTKLSDITFPDFEVDGKKYPLSYVLFENEYQFNSDIKIRRKAFEVFSKKIREYINTTANYYSAQVQKEKTLATLRGFESVTDYLLFPQRVSRELYNRQIDLIVTHLAPHMRRYAKLLQKVHNIEKMTFADLKISLDPQYDPEVTIEESKEYVKGALSVLGKEYMDLIMKSYDERWVDYAQNIGKSTGGFCSNPYGKNAYILLSWTGMLRNIYIGS